VGGGERISSFCKYQRKTRKPQDQFPFYSFWMGFIIGREKNQQRIGNDKKEEKCLAK
jgi:hypothetical protein